MARLLNSIQKEWGLRLNGTTQTTASSSTIDLSAQNKITVSFWMKLHAVTSAYQCITEFGNNQNSGFFVFMTDATTAPKSIYVGFSTGANWQFDTKKTGEWMHVVATIDRTLAIASVLTGYLNGARAGKLTDSAGASAGNFGNLTLYTGARGGSSLFSNHSMKDLRIYSGILTPAQINALYSQGVNKPYGSPLVWYKMDEGTGTTLANSGSIATASTITGRTTTGAAPSTMWVIDPVRPQRLATTSNTASVLFNGTSDKIVVADNAALDMGTGDFTFEFKVQKSTMAAASTYLMEKRDAGFIGYGAYFHESTAINKLNFVFDDAQYALASSNVYPTAGKWVHCICSVTRATQENFRIFVNGVYDVSYTNEVDYAATAGSIDNAVALEFMNQNGALFTKGSMYDVRLYNRALTDDECLSRYYTDENITSGRVGWWKMQEGSGGTVADSQGANNGTITGGAWTLNTQS